MKRVLLTVVFWLDALERALKSAAQGALLALGQDLAGADVFQADWRNILGVAGGMFVLSILTSIASARAPGLSPASIVPPGV